jgi:hypothetical protein
MRTIREPALPVIAFELYERPAQLAGLFYLVSGYLPLRSAASSWSGQVGGTRVFLTSYGVITVWGGLISP